MDYTPRIFHAVFTALLIIICLLLGVRYVRYQFAFNCGAIIFTIILLIVLLLLVMNGYSVVIDSMTSFAVAFSKLDDEGRAAMAFQFPMMRYEMKRGRVRAMFEETGVTIEQFRLFLQTSNRKYISPEREWCTSEKPRAVWIEIKDWLEANDRIIIDSAAGSHSWLWKGNSYNHLMAYWMSGRTLTNLNMVETET